MSRVRILNLPRDCTEEQLRQHLLTSLPPNAPPLQITDVFLKRGPSSSSSSSSGRGSHQDRSKGRHDASRADVIRMAFVGFQTAAAAKFVIDYFHNTYFRSARMHVEPAQSVQAARAAQQEKLDKLKRLKAEEQQKRTEAVMASRKANAMGGKRTREAVVDGEGSSPVTVADSKPSEKQKRRQQFVAERAAATTGASWTSELMVPQEAEGLATQGVLEAGEGGLLPYQDTEGGGGKTGSKKTKAEQKEASKKERTATKATKESKKKKEGKQTAEADDEAELLERQQALGDVSEMDFLSQIATNEPAEAPAAKKLKQEAQGPGDGGEGDDESGASSPADKKEAAQSKTEKQKAGGKKRVDDEEARQAAQEQLALTTRRVRLYNFPYVATEQQLKQFVTSRFGPIESIHLPLTKDTRQSKGAAFVRFVHPEDAVRCVKNMFGSIFMGRLMKVAAAEEDPYQQQAATPGSSPSSGGGGGEGGEPGVAAPAPSAGGSAFKQEKDRARKEQEEALMLNLIQDGEGAEEGEGEGGAYNERLPAPPATGPRKTALSSWNALYMNSSAAVQRVAQRLQLRSQDLVSVEAKGAATRAAIAEALCWGEEGIALDVLEASSQNLLRPRSATTILVKNVSVKSPEEAKALVALFSKFGVLELSAFPQSGLFALFRYSQAQDARVAFRRLSFQLFQGNPLYLEWAPVGAVKAPDEDDNEEEEEEAKTKKLPGEASRSAVGGAPQEEEEEEEDAAARQVAAATRTYILFLTNIPFQLQDEEELYAFLIDACPRFATQPEKYVRRVAFEKDKGRAFITLDSGKSMLYAQRQWHGKKLQDRVLSCVPSKSTTTTTALQDSRQPEEEEDNEAPPTRMVHAARHSSSASNSGVPPGCDPLKIVVKNLPFEATEQDVRTLFSAFSEVRSVRLPRKAQQFSHHREHHHRGFAFVEFLSETEAARAMQTLRATHLYGRHLVLEYARAEQ
eukprot:gene9497-6667_t